MVNEFIDKNYLTIKKAVQNLVILDKEDIIHECIIYFIENPKAKRIIEDGYALKYIVQMIKLNGWSKTAPYHQKYNKIKYTELNENLNIPEPEYSEEFCITDIEENLKGKNIFIIDRLMFEEYIKNKSLGSFSIKKLSNKLNISHSTLSHKIRLIKNQLT